MAYRRRRQRSFAGHSDRLTFNNVDQLTFKYMEMCKVGSSTDSDSEISPRWSDTSTMGYVSSAPENGKSRRASSLPHKPAGRHGGYSLFLDPYDGSSEDSDESGINVSVSSRQMRQQGKAVGGGCQLSGHSQPFVFHHPASVTNRDVIEHNPKDLVTKQQHPLDVQMKCESDSEQWVCELDVLPSQNNKANFAGELTTHLKTHPQILDTGLQLDAAGMHGLMSSVSHSPRSQTPGTESSFRMLYSSSESSCDFRALYKRKLSFSGAEVLEQQKRRCVCTMKEEKVDQDSAYKP